MILGPIYLFYPILGTMKILLKNSKQFLLHTHWWLLSDTISEKFKTRLTKKSKNVDFWPNNALLTPFMLINGCYQVQFQTKIKTRLTKKSKNVDFVPNNALLIPF